MYNIWCKYCIALERTLRAIFHTDTLIYCYRHAFYTAATNIWVTDNGNKWNTWSQSDRQLQWLTLLLTHVDHWLD